MASLYFMKVSYFNLLNFCEKLTCYLLQPQKGQSCKDGYNEFHLCESGLLQDWRGAQALGLIYSSQVWHKTKDFGDKEVIGFLLVVFAALDFISSYAGYNLTPFLGPVSTFSPIIFGSIGWLLINLNNEREEH